MIYIFSKPIHSGKTTSVFEWSKKHKNCSGILMPIVNGERQMFDIEKHLFFPCLEKIENEKTSTIGKYIFSNKAFNQANNIIIQAIKQKSTIVIIDEVGKLELTGKGFYKSVAFAKSNMNNNHLILIVRDTFLTEVVDFFNLSNYQVITNLTELTF